MRFFVRLLALISTAFSFTAIASMPTSTYDAEPYTAQDNEVLNSMAWLGGSNSSVYGFVAHSQYANYLNPKDAATFQLDYGSREFRIGLSWAHEISEQQRIKFSLEHFSQDNDFNFVLGSGHEFIGQNTAGIAYEYALSRRFLEAWHVNGYYFDANNGDLSSQTYTTPGGIYVENRNLVGGNGGGIGMGPRWTLWRGAEAEMTFGFDGVNFNTQNEPAKNKSGFGQNLYFTQQLTKNLDLQLMLAHRQPYQQYAASLNWAVYQKTDRRLGLQLQLSHMDSDVLPASNENIIGLGLSYQWGGNAKGKPQCFKGDTSCDLLNWSARSAAYLPGVFVQRDQSFVLK